MNAVSIPVKTALVSQFNREHDAFLADAKLAAPSIVRAVNRMRTMGILLKEIIGKEVVTENGLHQWLRDNPDMLNECEVEWLMSFVRTANKLEQGELSLFEDASGYTQIVMQCAGFLNPPEQRTINQYSHALTPAAQSIDLFMTTRMKFNELLKTKSEWNDETRHEVKESIEKTRVFLAELEAAL